MSKSEETGNSVTSTPFDCPCPPVNCIRKFGEFTIIRDEP